MVEGRTLGAFRDVVIIIGIAMLCFFGMQESMARVQARREQEARFAVARAAIGKMDEAYRQAVTNKSVNEQFFRQNELLIEYQKLILTLAYMPVVSAPAQANKAVRPPTPPAGAAPVAPATPPAGTAPAVPPPSR